MGNEENREERGEGKERGLTPLRLLGPPSTLSLLFAYFFQFISHKTVHLRDYNAQYTEAICEVPFLFF